MGNGSNRSGGRLDLLPRHFSRTEMSNVMRDRRPMKWRGVYAYRRRYLDEEAWEPVDAAMVRWALGDAYRDASLALDFLHEAGVSARRPPFTRRDTSDSPSVRGAPDVHKPRRPHRRPVRWAPSPWGNRDPSPGFHRMVLLLRAVRRTNCSLARSGRIGMRCYPVLRHARGNSAPVMSRDSGIRGHPHGLPVRGGSLRTVSRCRGFEAMRTPITSETGQSVCARGLPQVPLPTPAVAL